MKTGLVSVVNLGGLMDAIRTSALINGSSLFLLLADYKARIQIKYSRHTLSDTFLALKSCVTKGKCVTQSMSVRFRDIP